MLKHAETNTAVSLAASLFITNGMPYTEQKFNSITRKNKKKLFELYANNDFEGIANLYKLPLKGSVAIVRGLGLFMFYPVIDNKIVPLRKDGKLGLFYQRDDVEITVLHFSEGGNE